MSRLNTMSIEDLTGQLLVATPNIYIGSPMHNALIYIAKHDDQGSVGIIVNQPILNLTYSKLLSHFGINTNDPNILDRQIYFGGPVDTERGMILHSTDYIKRPLYTISEQNLALTSDLEILVDIASGRGPAKTFMTLGYAGWHPGQLEQEIVNNQWISLPFSNDLIFNEHSQDKWIHAYEILGIDPARLSPNIGHA